MKPAPAWVEDVASQELDYSPLVTLESINSASFEEIGVVHDWRNYIPEAVQKRWSELDRTTRLLLFVVAETQARAEDWD